MLVRLPAINPSVASTTQCDVAIEIVVVLAAAEAVYRQIVARSALSTREAIPFEDARSDPPPR